MNKLAMFVPLIKADAAQRLVYGYIDETPDRAKEVMDYATAKPAFESWSADMHKASGGKSFGNIRAQHDLKKAAGRLQEIVFDDEARRIEFCAHIVDDQEWAKVEAGVYTGFSPGGSYAKRWRDGDNHRYTPKVGELSIVDVPCIPCATFTMVKADGVEEAVEFVLDKAYEPGNDATKTRAEEMAKADGGSFKDHVVQARADLISENATAALAKMAEDPEPETEAESVEAVVAEPDRASALDAALAKAGAALQVGEPEVSALQVYAGAFDGKLLKSAVDLAIAPPSPEAVALIGADFTKSLAAIQAIRDTCAPLAKGLYTLSEVACQLRDFAWLMQDVMWEEEIEGDSASPLPQMAADLVNGIKAFLIAMATEEVAELLTSTTENYNSVDIVIEGDADEMLLASQIIDLVKADTARMEKAGARNSAADATRIQTIHDKACELGAGCADGGEAEKVAGLVEERDRLAKSVDTAVPLIEKLTEEVGTMRTDRAADREAMTKMQTEIERLGGQPAATKIDQAIMLSKEQDNGSLEKVEAEPMTIEKANELPPAERAHALEQIALNLLHKSRTPA